MSSPKVMEKHHYTREETLDKIQELVEFMQFSVKQDTQFRGSIIWYLTVNDGETIPFCVHLNEKDGKIVADGDVGGNADGNIKVDVSADDFFAIYNGEIGASQLAGMILNGRVYVRRFKYKQVSDFANSFEFSSQKWVDFYEYKRIQNETCQEQEEKADDTNENNLQLPTPLIQNSITIGNEGKNYAAHCYSLDAFSNINLFSFLSSTNIKSKYNSFYIEFIKNQIGLNSSVSSSTQTSLPSLETTVHNMSLLSPISPVVYEQEIEDSKEKNKLINLCFPLLTSYRALFNTYNNNTLSPEQREVDLSELSKSTQFLTQNPILKAMYQSVKDRENALNIEETQSIDPSNENIDFNSQSFAHNRDTIQDRNMSIDINDTSKILMATDTTQSQSDNRVFDPYNFDVYPLKSVAKSNPLTIPNIFRGLTQTLSTMDGEGFTNNPIMVPYVSPYMKIGTLKDKYTQNLKHRLLDTLIYNPNILNNVVSYGLPDMSQIFDENETKQTTNNNQSSVVSNVNTNKNTQGTMPNPSYPKKSSIDLNDSDFN